MAAWQWQWLWLWRGSGGNGFGQVAMALALARWRWQRAVCCRGCLTPLESNNMVNSPVAVDSHKPASTHYSHRHGY